MAITIDDLTANFRHLEREAVLEDWRWLIGPARQPILLAAIGDAFVQDELDGSVWQLDVAVPDVFKVADDLAAFQAKLAEREFVMRHFAVAAVVDLRENGKRLEPGQIYSYTHPPFLGGEIAFANIEPCDISVHFSILGQVAERVCS
jgi:hypothetical protein